MVAVLGWTWWWAWWWVFGWFVGRDWCREGEFGAGRRGKRFGCENVWLAGGWCLVRGAGRKE